MTLAWAASVVRLEVVLGGRGGAEQRGSSWFGRWEDGAGQGQALARPIVLLCHSPVVIYPLSLGFFVCKEGLWCHIGFDGPRARPTVAAVHKSWSVLASRGFKQKSDMRWWSLGCQCRRALELRAGVGDREVAKAGTPEGADASLAGREEEGLGGVGADGCAGMQDMGKEMARPPPNFHPGAGEARGGVAVGRKIRRSD